MAVHALDTFCDDISAIKSVFIGAEGMSSTALGFPNQGAESILSLRRSVTAWASELQRKNIDNTKVLDLAGIIEGHLRTLSVVSVLSKAETDSFIKRLHQLSARS